MDQRLFGLVTREDENYIYLWGTTHRLTEALVPKRLFPEITPGDVVQYKLSHGINAVQESASIWKVVNHDLTILYRPQDNSQFRIRTTLVLPPAGCTYFDEQFNNLKNSNSRYDLKFMAYSLEFGKVASFVELNHEAGKAYKGYVSRLPPDFDVVLKREIDTIFCVVDLELKEVTLPRELEEIKQRVPWRESFQHYSEPMVKARSPILPPTRIESLSSNDWNADGGRIAKDYRDESIYNAPDQRDYHRSTLTLNNGPSSPTHSSGYNSGRNSVVPFQNLDGPNSGKQLVWEEENAEDDYNSKGERLKLKKQVSWSDSMSYSVGGDFSSGSDEFSRGVPGRDNSIGRSFSASGNPIRDDLSDLNAGNRSAMIFGNVEDDLLDLRGDPKPYNPNSSANGSLGLGGSGKNFSGYRESGLAFQYSDCSNGGKHVVWDENSDDEYNSKGDRANLKKGPGECSIRDNSIGRPFSTSGNSIRDDLLDLNLNVGNRSATIFADVPDNLLRGGPKPSNSAGLSSRGGDRSGTHNELLSAEIVRLRERNRVLEKELSSVVTFFGNFIANANVSKYNSMVRADDDISESPKPNIEKRSF